SRDINSTLRTTATRTPLVKGTTRASVSARDLQTSADKASCASKKAMPASIIAQIISLSREDACLAAAAGIHHRRETNRPTEISETLASRMAKILPGWSRTSKAMTCGKKMQPNYSNLVAELQGSFTGRTKMWV